MSYSYSPSTGGFYISGVHPTIPSDAIAVSDAQHAALLAGMNSGQVIAVVAGVPTLQAAPVAVPTQAQLQAYANARAQNLLGVMNSYTASGATIKADANASTVADLLALAQWGAANPAASFNWIADDNSSTPVTGAQFVALAPLVGAYRMTVYGTALSAVLAGIAAATITTTAEIDAYAWPA